jgi:hypothetical protein
VAIDVPAADTSPADTADTATAELPVLADAAGADAAEVVVPAWNMGLPASSEMGTRRAYSIARAIIHMHNVYSHDACDNTPKMPDGSNNEACHQQMRDGLCTDNIDFAMMTDHYAFVAATDNFADLYMSHAGDTWEDEAGVHSANVMHCPGGHDTRIMVGMEGEASPVGIMRHPVDGDTDARTAAYQDTSAAGVKLLRDAGAVPVVIHIEDRTDQWLDTVDLDLMETCNLHILLAANIRTMVGLDPDASSAAFVAWVFQPDQNPKAADLVFLEFHQRVDYYMNEWDRELGLRMMGGFAGNDVHQNVIQTPMADGERPDGYRRMMKWYVNHVLVTERTGAAIREALHARRLYEVFEVLGTPADFDFRADRADGTTFEMGEVIPAGGAVTLRAPVPHALGADPAVDTIRMVLRQITPAGAATVYDGPGPLEYPVTTPGRYRLEVFIIPNHLVPYMETAASRLLKEFPWVYSNPIEVQ